MRVSLATSIVKSMKRMGVDSSVLPGMDLDSDSEEDGLPGCDGKVEGEIEGRRKEGLQGKVKRR